MTMLSERVDVVIGVDTHLHTVTGAAVGAVSGVELGEVTVSADPAGYEQLVDFAVGRWGRRVWAIEGTGSYGSGLRRHLDALGEEVLEADRPHRVRRRHGAKSDSIDAYRAAREALSRSSMPTPRATGLRKALAVHLAARRSAIEAATQARMQLHAVTVTAPETLRDQFRGRSITAMVPIAARLRPARHNHTETRHTATTLKLLAQRIAMLDQHATEHEHAITAIVTEWRPDLLELCGVGPINAATILCAWSHPGRVRNDAAFAMLAGTAPIPAHSGTTHRHRLNRSGDRQLNRAIHNIAICRLRYDPTTRAYRDRRRTEGKTDQEIRRAIKRYITRQLFRQLQHPPLDTP